jgi:hypothetical protein
MSGSQISSKHQSMPFFSNQDDNWWIVDTTGREKLSKIPPIIRTKYWLLEQLAVRHWFYDFGPPCRRAPGQEDGSGKE